MHNAEQHHLARCIARFCALRPGSLGQPREDRYIAAAELADYPDFLVWGDIRLESLQGPVSFMLHLQIRNLKTNSLTNGEKATQNTKLNFRIRTPSLADNLLYSIPHRLLVIGLRRGVFDNVADLNDLIHGSQQNILIKPAFLNVAVFLRSSPGGRTLTDQPMFAYSFTTYLSEHGQRIGYIDKITLYSFRWRTLSDLQEKYGTETAKTLADHDSRDNTTCDMNGRSLFFYEHGTPMFLNPDGTQKRNRDMNPDEQQIVQLLAENDAVSDEDFALPTNSVPGPYDLAETSTLIQAYLHRSYMYSVDLTGALIANEQDESATIRATADELALTRLSDEQVAEMYGAAINALTQQIIEADPDCPQNPRERKPYAKRVRRLALKQLRQEMYEVRRRAETVDSIAHWREEILQAASTFARRLRGRATAVVQEQHTLQQDDWSRCRYNTW